MLRSVQPDEVLVPLVRGIGRLEDDLGDSENELEFDWKPPNFPDLLSFCWKRFPLLLLLLCSLLLMTSFLK